MDEGSNGKGAFFTGEAQAAPQRSAPGTALSFCRDVPRQTGGCGWWFNSPPSAEGQWVARIHPAQHLRRGLHLQFCKSLMNFLEQLKVPAESANQLRWSKET